MKIHNPPMNFIHTTANGETGAQAFDRWNDSNKDGYGNACVRYASEWATRMDKLIEELNPPMATLSEQLAFLCSTDGPGYKGRKLSHAERLSYEADDEGITGFMYGCAVRILVECWAYGEALRRWHNKETQIGTEGDAANDKPGAVLNPAVLCVGAAPAGSDS